MAHLFGPSVVSASRSFGTKSDLPEFLLPGGADLNPPDPSEISKREGTNRGAFHVDAMRGGDLCQARELIFHFSGALEGFAPRKELATGGRQGQIDFQLPGWLLTLAPQSPAPDCSDFSAVARAVPDELPISLESVEWLERWLFLLASFTSNREVGVGPVCGVAADECVLWVDWGAPRVKAGKPGVGWCTTHLVPSALPALANGLATIAADLDLEVILDRAIGYSLAANGDEVIEVRIPIACSGLELLAWAILQREGWLVDPGRRRRLGPAAMLRLLLNWAGIPTDVPPSLPSLGARCRAAGKPHWGGPEILFDIRNAMVHPPKHLEDPEWPDGDDLVEAWQLGTWYLELVLLRAFHYDGEYWSRVRLNRPAADVEPVPWS